MNLQRWLLEREPEWKEIEDLLTRSNASIYLLSPSEIRRLSLLYRGLMNDLSRSRSSPYYQELVPYLNNLAQRVHTRIYETAPIHGSDVLGFFTTSFPRCFRKYWAYIFASFLAFSLGALVSMVTVQLAPETAGYFLPSQILDQLAEGHLWTESVSAAPSESTFLMSNNIRVAVTAYAAGILFGFGTLLILFQNGMFAFGGPLQACFMHNMGDDLLLFMVPHGVIELSTIMIVGGAGMIIGNSLLFPGDLPRWEAVKSRARDSLTLVMGCIPLLIIAGIIEGMISLNTDVPDPIRIVIASLTGLLLYLYLGLSGRSSN